jgi:predicted AlkP superfamily pyrophosphatase or phosphodiesterase
MRMGGVGAGWWRGFDPRAGVAGRVVALWLVAALVSCATPSQKAAKQAEEGERQIGRMTALQSKGPPTRIILMTVAGLKASDFLTSDGYVAADGGPVRMPNLATLARQGVVGERAFPPSPGSTYASHATLVTGLLPSRHGIVADTYLEEAGSASLPFWSSQKLKGTALWDAAIGRGVMALGWPTTIDARIELVLPEARSSDKDRPWLDFMRGISSPYLIRHLEAIEADTLAADAGDTKPVRPAASWPSPSEKDAALSEVACHVALSERDPGLWLIRFDQTQIALQTSGVGSLEVAAALRRIDDEIGALMDCLEEAGRVEDTAIFVIGDVGYESVHTRVDPNVVLVQKGLIGRDPRSAIGMRGWLAVARSQGKSAYIYAKDADNAVAARKILEEEAERTGAFRVVSAADLAKTDVDPQAWFGLAAMPGFEIGNGMIKPMLQPAEARASAGALRLSGDTSSAVGFVAWGRGVRQHVRIPELDLVDVAPTISMLFGLRLDETLDGEPITGILRASVPLPPPGPKRIGVDNDGDVDRTLRELGGGR